MNLRRVLLDGHARSFDGSTSSGITKPREWIVGERGVTSLELRDGCVVVNGATMVPIGRVIEMELPPSEPWTPEHSRQLVASPDVTASADLERAVRSSAVAPTIAEQDRRQGKGRRR